MPFTLRLAYHALGAVSRAGLLLFVAWLMLIPANENEAEALGTTTRNQYPSGLRAMRTARVVVAIAPERTYDIMAFALGPDIAPWMVRLGMMQMAAGNLLPTTASIPEPGSAQSDRDISGPRFIQVD
jgi:hypothetical protein